MPTVRLKCPCGHIWKHDRSEPIPADLREICPVCTLADQNTLDPSSLQGPASPPVPSGPPNPPSGTIVQSPSEQIRSASASTPPVAPGRVIAGFEILEELNRGGMGVIYKARQMGLNRLVALKVISPTKLDHPGARARFKREVAAAALLNHPNIVTVFHTDLDGAYPYLAMEYVPGIDLLRLVRTNGPQPVADAVYYIRQAAEGLQHAFEQGLVHRDIKPANLMVTPGPFTAGGGRTGKLPRVKILDMGLARVVNPDSDAERDPEAQLTQDGVFLGTPDYISPEQAEDSRQADIRSDIYSLGGSLYFLLTGEVPFPGSTVVQKLRRALTEPPPSPMARRKDVPPSLDGIVRKMMARDPDSRYQTPNDVLTVLDRVARGETVAVPTAPAPGSTLHAVTAISDAGLSGQVTPTAQVKAHEGGVHGLAVDSEGQFVLTGGTDSKLRLWHPVKLKEVRTLTGDLGAVEQLALVPGGKWVATCCIRLTTSEMGVQLWDMHTGAERRRLRGPADNIRCVAVSQDGKVIAAGSDDSMVWVWSADASGPKTFCMKGHAGPVTGLVFVTPDSLLSAGADGVVRQWDLRAGKSKGALPAPVGQIEAVAYGGKKVAVAGQTLAVRQTTGVFVRFDGHDGPVTCCAFSPDGRLLASGGADSMLRVWSTDDGTEIASYPGHSRAILSVGFDATGTAIYSGSDGGNLRRWPIPVV